MNINSLIDTISLKTAAVLCSKMRYFSKSYESERLDEITGTLTKGLDSICKIGVNELEGTFNSVDVFPAVNIVDWKGSDYPLLIYHHGAAEGRYDRSFKMIFNKNFIDDIGVNLICIRAPFSKSNKDFIQAIKKLDSYTALITGSCAAIEAAIIKFREISGSPVYVTGTSLGGIVCCLHKLQYDSATAYIPLYAGPQVGNVFTDSAYSVICDEAVRSKHAEKIKDVLNFGDSLKQSRNMSDVFPLLGKYDRIFDFDSNHMYYNKENISITDKGHSTGASSGEEIREHIKMTLISDNIVKRR